MEYLLVFMTLTGAVEGNGGIGEPTPFSFQPHTVTMQRLPSYEACVKAAKAAEAMTPEQVYVTNGRATAGTKSRWKCVQLQSVSN